MIFSYIDAGSGSLLVQLMAGGAAGLIAFLRFRWGSIRRRFRSPLAVSDSAVSKNESLRETAEKQGSALLDN
jgi:hypothetical protein